MKPKKCKPSVFAVINGENITYGYRCHHHTKRYSTQGLRDERMEKHRKEAKREAKKG